MIAPIYQALKGIVKTSQRVHDYNSPDWWGIKEINSNVQSMRTGSERYVCMIFYFWTLLPVSYICAVEW